MPHHSDLVSVPTYSIAICPDQDVMQKIKLLKNLLEKEIGPNKSSLAEPEIPIAFFEADEKSLRNLRSSLERFCEETQSFIIQLKGLSTIPKTLYLAPNAESKAELLEFIKNFRKKISKLKSENISNTAHITIGTELSEMKIDKAFKLFNEMEIDMAFLCDHICLKKFDVIKKQYQTEQRFMFGNKEIKPSGEQVSLW